MFVFDRAGDTEGEWRPALPRSCVGSCWASVTGGCARCARGWTISVVPDQKAPRSFGDDRQVLTLLLQYQRESLARKVFGVSEVAARQSPVPSGTTLLWLVEHLAHAERL